MRRRFATSQRPPPAHAVRWVRDPDQRWSRWKLQLLIVGVGLSVAVLLIFSIVDFIRHGYATTPVSGSGDRAPTSGQTPQDADALAAEPMPTAALSEATPGALTNDPIGRLSLPPASRVGGANVASGFPPTQAGAMAQLIAINQQAMESSSLARGQQVINEWAEPGGPTAQSWSTLQALQSLATGAGAAGDGTGLSIQLDPAMGLVKGSIGSDYVIPCVLFVVSVSTGGPTQQAAAADCQRMHWTGERWLIAAGAEPAPAPAVWPGTPRAAEVGYRWLDQEG